jgi:OOP family OmpA-OmpF porin
MRYSEAKFGYGRVEDRMWLDASLPDGWQVRIFKLIEALALLNEGSATMTPEGLDIAGDAGFENPDEELSKLLAGGYSADETTLNISYTEPAGGEGGRGLDPRLCVSRITKILAESSIVFTPSSAVISDPSIPTIEAIAALLTTCREARIEIGGHTDSQGREEMNRALSQGRADAVLDALLAQNLLLGDISAKGYGESEPIADNGSEAGRAANRRIEFKLLREEPEAPAAPAPEEEPVGAGQVAPNDFTRPAMRAPVSEESQ